MPKALEYSCQVTNGHIPVEVSRAIATALRGLEGKRVIVSLREHKRKRSTNQNSFHWGVVIPRILEMFTDAGNDTTPEEVHEFLKEHVGGSTFVKVLLTPDGKRRPVVRSSTSLTTEEWETWMERIRAWAAELGCIVPLPNEDLIHQGE